MSFKIKLKSIIRQGLRFLLAQNSKGYPEAVHYLTLPCITPSGVEYQTHLTNLFQRMIVLDSLLDCAGFDGSITKQIVEKEIIEILQAKHRIVRGGWSYIPSLQELPPDADDLGMVLQILARTGGKELASVCDDALDILCKYHRHPDGSFDLWIVDPSDTSSSASVIRNYINVIGGKVVSPDVVSNLLWGLILYDKDRFQQQIEDGVCYLKSCQMNEGFWKSKWYWGDFYATFRSLMVLDDIDPKSESIIRAQRFICDTQNDDGGWGDKVSNPIDTAFALLSLSTKPNFAENKLKGIKYLITTQLRDGSWERVPFIKVETIDGVKTYESRTITTSFCIKALVKIISMDSGLEDIIIDIDNFQYKRQLGNLTIYTNDNWQWALSRDCELLQRNKNCVMDKLTYQKDSINNFPALHIIVLTDKCNQACTYCAASAQPDQISISNLDNNNHILSKIVDFIVHYSESNFCVEFQGGEPLLNLSTLQYIVDEISERAIKFNKKPIFRLVSNLTLLNPDIVDYIALKDIQVSTSLDGLEFLHNKHRKLRIGENSYTIVVEGINQLRRRGVRVGILTVITQDALEIPEDIVDNLAKLRIHRLMLKPVFQIGYAEKSWKALCMDPESYSYFWKRFVKRCFAYHLQNISILDYTTELLVRKIMMVQEPNYVDLKSPCGCVHGQIAYDLQGNIYPCDEARLNQKIILGNVLNDSFDEISRSQEALKIINASLIDTNRCGLCSYRPWCGRCPVINRMHFCEYDVPSEKTYGCRIWKSIFDRFFELVAEYPESIRFVESMIKADDIIRFQNPSIFNQKYGDHQLRDKSQKFGKLRL